MHTGKRHRTCTCVKHKRAGSAGEEVAAEPPARPIPWQPLFDLRERDMLWSDELQVRACLFMSIPVKTPCCLEASAASPVRGYKASGAQSRRCVFVKASGWPWHCTGHRRLVLLLRPASLDLSSQPLPCRHGLWQRLQARSWVLDWTLWSSAFSSCLPCCRLCVRARSLAPCAVIHFSIQ